jgi:hypothetical protein
MSGDVVPIGEAPAQLDTFAAYWKLAQRIADTEFVPNGLRRRPDAVLACVLHGTELGMGPMQSLHAIDVIQGKPTLKPEAMRARVLANGHHFQVTRLTDKAVAVKGWRRGQSPADGLEVEWTMDRAKMAKLLGKSNWETYPRAMLLARATAELCRAIFPDVLSGLSYTADELGDGDVVDVEPLVDLETGEIVEEAAPADEEWDDPELFGEAGP